MRSIILVLILSFGLLSKLCSQTVTVMDEQSNLLPYAHVSITDTVNNKKTYIITDINGLVVLPNYKQEEKSNLKLKVSYLGFIPFEGLLNTLDNYEIRLKPNSVQLNQFVVTGQHNPSSSEKSVHKIKVLDAERIESQGAVNLRDIMRNENNIRISQDNILGSGISMQGISGQNVKILIDGVPVIGRLNGNIDLNQINLNNIERIEVVEGPMSVNYGSDALAGTINLITKKGQEKRFEIQSNSYYESVGQYNTDLSAGIQIKDNHFSIGGGRNYFDGWNPNESPFTFPSATLANFDRYIQWKPKEQLFFNTRYIMKWRKINFSPYYDMFKETVLNRGTPRLPYFETAFDETYKTDRSNSGFLFDWTRTNGRLEIVGAYNHYERIKNTYFKDLTTLAQSLTTESSDQDTTLFEQWMSRGTYAFGMMHEKMSLQIGYDFNQEISSGKRIETGTQSLGNYAVFSSAEWNVNDKLTIRPGLRWGVNTDYEHPLIPSINAKWYKSLKNDYRITLRGSYAKGFRAPSLKEMHFEFVDINHQIFGNPSLNAEQSNNYALHIDFDKTQAQRRFKVHLGGFYNQIHNRITLSPQPGTNEFTYLNTGEFFSQGIQTNGEIQLKHLSGSAGYSYIGRLNKEANNTINRLNYSPEFRSNLSYRFYGVGLTASLFYKYTGELPNVYTDDEGVLQEFYTESFHTLDFTLVKKLWNEKITWTIGAKNLMDVQNILSTDASGTHADNSNTAAVNWGRSYFTSLKFDLKW